MDVIGVLVAGLIIGLLGKLVGPGGKDNPSGSRSCAGRNSSRKLHV